MSSSKTPNLVLLLLLLLQAFYKSARVEWVPVGVVGAIVPWNWPFHNIINPISAAVMAGNAIVIKVSGGG
jgi:acyl-CoA reductase-like NAD-dependent aldehyde dehydrogenase